MVLLDIDGTGLLILICGMYFVCHIPAIIMVIVGLVKQKNNPELAKTLFLLAGIYFVIGLGICGSMLVG